MYQKLEDYLSGYFYADYWYDEGVDIAQNIISNFTKQDWEQLQNQLSKQTVEWKKRLAYCLYDTTNPYQFLTLVKLLDTEEKELLEITLDSLRDFINQETVRFLQQNTNVISQIKKLYNDNTSKIIHIMLTDFIHKMYQFIEQE